LFEKPPPYHMFIFEYNHTDYYELFCHVADKLGGIIKDNRAEINSKICSGYLQYEKLPNGIELHIYDYTFYDETYIHRIKSQEEYYILRFEKYSFPGEFITEIDDESIKESDGIRSSVYLTNTMFDLSYRAPAGVKATGINMNLSPQWMAKYIGITQNEEVLAEYIRLKSASYNMEVLDREYNKYLDEIMDKSLKEHPLYPAKLENSVMMLIERFFTRVAEKMRNKQNSAPRYSREDLMKVMEVENCITARNEKNIPTIDDLARKSLMSTSKLKKLFKDVYGAPIFEYHQRSRMEKAKYMLLSGNYSVKDIGYSLGYSNLSNFSTAFKKEFNCLPSEITSR
jgi:AraC-like DNA-binding protein